MGAFNLNSSGALAGGLQLVASFSVSRWLASDPNNLRRLLVPRLSAKECAPEVRLNRKVYRCVQQLFVFA